MKIKIKFFNPVTGCLIMFIFFSVRTDDPFEHFDWQKQKNVSYQKPWMVYLNALVGSQNSYFVAFWAKSNCKLSFVQMIAFLAERQNSRMLVPLFEIPRRIKYSFQPYFVYWTVGSPLFELHNSKIFMVYDHDAKIRREVVIVSVNKLLRSKITFVKLKIYSYFHIDSCELNVTIHSATTKSNVQNFTFCGIYKRFSFYPYGNLAHFVLNYLDPEDFELEVVFDILAPNVIKYSSLEYETRSDL